MMRNSKPYSHCFAKAKVMGDMLMNEYTQGNFSR